MSLQTQLAEDLAAAYADEEGSGEVWEIENGSEFTASFTLLTTDQVLDMFGDSSIVAAELRWRETDLAALDPDTIVYRQLSGNYWKQQGEPDEDGFGEIIATIKRFQRKRIGGR